LLNADCGLKDSTLLVNPQSEIRRSAIEATPSLTVGLLPYFPARSLNISPAAW
jgi:hypothetical protein